MSNSEEVESSFWHVVGCSTFYMAVFLSCPMPVSITFHPLDKQSELCRITGVEGLRGHGQVPASFVVYIH